MDGFDIASKSVAIVGGILLATKAVMEMHSSRVQRESELRWKQASMAREILKEFHADKNAMDAIEMLDWGAGQHAYGVGEQRDLQIAEEDVVEALKKDRTRATGPKDEYVWRCFDWLFFRIDRLEHHVGSDFLLFEDIVDVFRPYVAKIRTQRERYRHLLATQDYRNVERFLARFEPRAAPGA
jgi:hypothetical protein